ncbi:MAG: hypothetical protein A2Y33_16555 [Spirochaetes bacterium GWF1_51_8]|nr:MAG: hypothetical protein A2Y33_16555 [Spirochaetes bacterium GWF1_51_8]
MEINGLGGIRPIDNTNKPNKVNLKSDSLGLGSDNVEISEEAKKLAELSKYQEVVANSPDIREDKIAEVKAKLESGAYNNEEVMNAVAEKLMKVLGL